jgi:hypothetical protein
MQLTAHRNGCICEPCMSYRRTVIDIELGMPGEIIPNSTLVNDDWRIYVTDNPFDLVVSLINTKTFDCEIERHTMAEAESEQ